MKIVLILILFISSAIAQESDSKKKYTENEFQDAVTKEVERQINLVKKKSITQLTKELLAQEREYKSKTKKLDFRTEQLKKGEMGLLKKIESFEVRQKKLIGCIDKNREGERLRIKQLVSVISNMKPAKAAELLSVQESNISVKIIERIEPQKASKIFNLMDKNVSAKLQKQYLKMKND